MFSALHKKKTIRIFLLISAALFAGFLMFSPFLHDHAPTLHTHNDCPAHMFLSSTLAVGAIIFAILIVLCLQQILVIIQDHQIAAQETPYFLFINRAPPLSN
ncbi:MAG: hypothetical protein GF372_06100 [Candidatus Marinimicrobia bacterium]|nr:hypothetical protein [Candidatus Neomarinimicrobiota bacterium]